MSIPLCTACGKPAKPHPYRHMVTLEPVERPGPRNLIVGFDPGKTGGLVAVWEDSGRVKCWQRLPLIGRGKRQRIDGRTVARFLRIDVLGCSVERPTIAVERVGAFPDEGVVGVFNFGKATGTVIGIAEAAGFRIEEVGPADWQRVMLRGHPRQPKAQRKASCALVASDLHPELHSSLQVKANWGLADAALIAEFYRRQTIKNAVKPQAGETTNG